MAYSRNYEIKLSVQISVRFRPPPPRRPRSPEKAPYVETFYTYVNFLPMTMTKINDMV